ncbi:helix-turn-helix domain-containing protein [Streptomyces violascens]|uniref:helix-turn-helix domain-containing protein n=1 Tax=Streptomyces violascens TaxID=67381 RepID=UPI00167A2C9B|nr:XRE family transcriptional regulator [Streptomyces violascens]GGU10378.1 hypothetical protein GCM10010289_34410 [Streptomyces violascens]
MPRWKALPEELDPQVREFASQLRRLVDRSGLSVAAIADRTGYSKTSWERYLGGRLLAPKAAVLALAEVTGTHPVHLTTMWELAERAWSRSEQRHDRTMGATQVAQARAALGEFGPAEPPGGVRAHTPSAGLTDRRPKQAKQWAPKPPAAPGHHRRRIVMFLAGVVGALLVITSAVLLTDLGKSDGKQQAKPTPTHSAPAPVLPAGVKCVAASCTGQDPEVMGCTDKLVQTVGSAKVGVAVVEVRYSRTCGAAWARLKQVAPGDRVQISSGGTAGEAVVADAYRDTYTKMLAVSGPAAAKACATLKSGKSGCAAGKAAAGATGKAGTATTGQ